jgi:hypothetical protein
VVLPSSISWNRPTILRRRGGRTHIAPPALLHHSPRRDRRGRLAAVPSLYGKRPRGCHNSGTATWATLCWEPGPRGRWSCWRGAVRNTGPSTYERTQEPMSALRASTQTPRRKGDQRSRRSCRVLRGPTRSTTKNACGRQVLRPSVGQACAWGKTRPIWIQLPARPSDHAP